MAAAPFETKQNNLKVANHQWVPSGLACMAHLQFESADARLQCYIPRQVPPIKNCHLLVDNLPGIVWELWGAMRPVLTCCLLSHNDMEIFAGLGSRCGLMEALKLIKGDLTILVGVSLAEVHLGNVQGLIWRGTVLQNIYKIRFCCAQSCIGLVGFASFRPCLAA